MKLYNLYIFATCSAVRLPNQTGLSNETNSLSNEVTMIEPQENTGTIALRTGSEKSTNPVTAGDDINDVSINATEITVIESEIEERIIAGKSVKKADIYPSFASIRENGYHICGGIILDEYRILTATHCGITDKHTVGVGGIERDGSDIQQNVRICHVTNHPDFSFPENDISVIQLSEKLDFSTSKVQPIEIATEEELEKVKKGTEVCYIVGQGKTDDEYTASIQLQSGRQLYTSEKTCKNYSSSSTINDHCFMTRDDDAGSQGCRGDSGGPLYCQVGDQMKLFGIASFVGNTDCSDGWTGWTLPTKYSDFINSIYDEYQYECNGSSPTKMGLFFILALVAVFL